jgi:hypothetical protein
MNAAAPLAVVVRSAGQVIAACAANQPKCAKREYRGEVMRQRTVVPSRAETLA